MPQPGSPANAVPRGEGELIRRIEDIERRQRDEGLSALMAQIGPVIAEIRTQQEALVEQQAALAAAQEDLAGVIAQQVAVDAVSVFSSGVSATATPAAVASAGRFVPAGFTRALVAAFSSGSAGTSAINLRTRIEASDGGMMTAVYGSASSHHAVSLTGLAPGSTITASTLIAAIPNYATCMVTTTLVVIYLR